MAASKIRNTYRKKTMAQRDMEVKIINSIANLFSPLIIRMFNEHIENYIFSGTLQLSNISLWFSIKKIISTVNKIIDLYFTNILHLIKASIWVSKKIQRLVFIGLNILKKGEEFG